MTVFCFHFHLKFYSVSILIFLFDKCASEKLLTVIWGTSVQTNLYQSSDLGAMVLDPKVKNMGKLEMRHNLNFIVDCFNLNLNLL